jgi:hypothetical protein
LDCCGEADPVAHLRSRAAKRLFKTRAEISGFPATRITEVRKMIDPTIRHST